MNNYLDTHCADRSSPFEIDKELRVRKILEGNTDYHYEFRKNDDQYGFDLECYSYTITGSDWSRQFLAYVEVEVSVQWENEYPKFWRTYSFLKRKTHIMHNGRWVGLRKDTDKTIYVIFNNLLTDAVAISMVDSEHGKEESCNKTGDKYHDDCSRFPFSSQYVTRGLDNCLEKIRSFTSNCLK